MTVSQWYSWFSGRTVKGITCQPTEKADPDEIDTLSIVLTFTDGSRVAVVADSLLVDDPLSQTLLAWPPE